MSAATAGGGIAPPAPPAVGFGGTGDREPVRRPVPCQWCGAQEEGTKGGAVVCLFCDVPEGEAA